MKYLVEKYGKGGISAKIVADSFSPNGTRLTTMELEYPRFIHAEFMTHRMLSKNAASSRAIPVEKNIEMIRARTAMPVHWGKNQPGMSAKEECNALILLDGYETIGFTREETWNRARDKAIEVAESLHKAGYHKQIVNRLLEPYTFIKVVASGTEWDNLLWLREHPDAQPEFQELAACILSALNYEGVDDPNLYPIDLVEGEWHVPYFGRGFWSPSSHAGEPSTTHSLFDALMISSSCCAQVSYRKNDDTLEKAKVIYDRLVESKPVHASPFEHQATPILANAWENPRLLGKCLYDHHTGDVWSGNFRNWYQYRQKIDGNVCNNYEKLLKAEFVTHE